MKNTTTVLADLETATETLPKNEELGLEQLDQVLGGSYCYYDSTGWTSASGATMHRWDKTVCY